MEISATAHSIRVSPRKMQLITRAVKHLSAKNAVVTLSHLNKSGAAPLKKVIDSALANAKNKNVVNLESLVFKELQVLPGSAMKRFRAVSRGMAHSYKKRMSHVRVTLQTVEKPIATVKTVAKKDAEEKVKS